MRFHPLTRMSVDRRALEKVGRKAVDEALERATMVSAAFPNSASFFEVYSLVELG